MIQLIQKGWASKKEVTIEDDGLLINTKDIKEDLEYRIRFEELGFDIIKKRVKSANIPFYIFLVFDLLYIGLIISSIIDKEPFSQQLFWVGALGFFSIMTVMSFYSRNKDVIYLTGGQKALELLAVKPDKESVSAFIEAVHKAMRLHYKNKYTSFDPDTPYEVKQSQLSWLKEIKAINSTEYEELLKESKTENIIGYKRPNWGE